MLVALPLKSFVLTKMPSACFYPVSISDAEIRPKKTPILECYFVDKNGAQAKQRVEVYINLLESLSSREANFFSTKETLKKLIDFFDFTTFGSFHCCAAALAFNYNSVVFLAGH